MAENKFDDAGGSLVHLVANWHVSESDPIHPSNNPDSASFGKYYKSHFAAGQETAA